MSMTPTTALVLAAVIAAVTSILTTVLLRYVVDDKLQRRRARTEYEYAQRKALREVMGKYEGPMLQAAEDFHLRMRNVYRNASKPWLAATGKREGYYRVSTVYRLVSLIRLAVQLEQRALYLDATIREERDTITLRYAKAFQAVLTGSDLFSGTGYDTSRSADHIFRDRLRGLADLPLPDGQGFTYAYFESGLKDDGLLTDVFDFVDGLSPQGTPLRWDRLVALDLLLLAYIDRVGFDDAHRLNDDVLTSTVAQFVTPEVRVNFVDRFLPYAGLSAEPQIARVIAAMRT
jgi:hypothetical protein